MTVTISPAAAKGQLRVPASKSAMQRACAAALLHRGTTIIDNPGHCNDDLAAIAVIQSLGARVHPQEQKLTVQSNGVAPVNDGLYCGESGLGIRMFTPVAALSNQPLTITGSGSLVTRPMHFFDEILPQLGVSVQSANGHLPLAIKGPLVPGDITVDGSLSSQFLTGLLMAFGAAATIPVTITVTNLKSRPYIDLTLEVMRHFGQRVEHEAYGRFTILPRAAAANTIHYTVEGDWSSASFLLVAGAIGGHVTLEGLRLHSSQADKAILQALAAAEARVSIREDHIHVNGGDLRAFHFDATDCPDLFPPLAALASQCEGTTVIAGVSRLAHKESNRALTLQEEFGKMGLVIDLQDDLMMIKGKAALQGATVHSRHDHRIAMACAIAALNAAGPVTIEAADAINKSYPDFWDHCRLSGIPVEG